MNMSFNFSHKTAIPMLSCKTDGMGIVTSSHFLQMTLPLA